MESWQAFLIARYSFIALRFPQSIWLAISFILGICWQAQHISIYATTAAAGALLFLTQQTRHVFLHISTLSLLFVIGAWRSLDHQTTLLKTCSDICEKPLYLKAEVIDTHAPPAGTITVKLLDVKNSNTQEKLLCTSVHVQLILNKKHPIVAPGDIIEVQRVWFPRPAPQQLISLQRRDVVARAYVSSEQKITISAGKRSFMSACATVKNDLMEKIYQSLALPAATFVSSIFLGITPPDSLFMQQLRTMFSWWGINHYLARSGLHLALIAYILLAGLCIIPISYSVKHIITFLCIMLYTCLSWPSISFIRATMMICCSIFCVLVKAPYNNLHLLMCTTIAVLFYNPFYISCLEFQLSFFLTLGLALIQHADMIMRNNHERSRL